MPRGRQKGEIRELHRHDWHYQGRDVSQQRCNCGAVLVSRVEFDRRKKEWEAYYEQVKQSDSYSDFKEMEYYFRNWQAFHNPEDLDKIREIEKKIHKRTEKINDTYDPFNLDADWETHYDYMPKPYFPDPSTYPKYEVAGE